MGAKGITSTITGKEEVLPETRSVVLGVFLMRKGYICFYSLIETREKKDKSLFLNYKKDSCTKPKIKTPEQKVSFGYERNFLNIRAVLFGNSKNAEVTNLPSFKIVIIIKFIIIVIIVELII